jgi:hypothetical protein
MYPYIYNITCDALLSSWKCGICFTGYHPNHLGLSKFPPRQVVGALRSDQYGVAECKENHWKSIHAGWMVIANDWERMWLAERCWAATMVECNQQMRKILHWVHPNHLRRAIIIIKLRHMNRWVHPNHLGQSRFPPRHVVWAWKSYEYGMAECEENLWKSIHAGCVVIANDWERIWLAERWWAATMIAWNEQMRRILHWVHPNHFRRARIIMKMQNMLYWVHKSPGAV